MFWARNLLGAKLISDGYGTDQDSHRVHQNFVIATCDNVINHAHRPYLHNDTYIQTGRDKKFGGNKTSNEHLTESYTKPQLTLSPHLAP